MKDSASGNLLRPQIRNRITALRWLTLLALFACAVQLVNVQIIQGPTLAAEGRKNRVVDVEIPATRGSIVDSEGRVLAVSDEKYDIAVNQRNILNYKRYDSSQPGEKVLLGTGPVEAAKQLSEILEMDVAELGGKMVGDATYVILKKSVSPQIWREIRDLRIEGIEYEKKQERSYPNGNTAATILGSINKEGDALAGIEFTQNDVLEGEAGAISSEIGPTGQIIPGGYQTETPMRPGATVHLTINSDLNHYAQESLDRVVLETQAEWGAVIVIDTKTGKVLALADSLEKAPLEKRPNEDEFYGSRAVQYTYEPGSVAKLFTFATALEEGTISPYTPVVSTSEITMPNGQTFKDSYEHPRMNKTATGILADSSNTGTVQIGDTVTDEQRYQTMKLFGLGELTGIELPGEASGLLAPYDKWDGRQRYTTMFGQGMAASPLQMTQAVAAIVNGGVRMPLSVVDGWTLPDGGYKENVRGEVVRVMSEDKALELTGMMEVVTSEEGTGLRANVPGYRTVAKTGTSEIISSAGVNSGTVASFVGAAPAEAPRIAVGVVIFRPQSGIYGAVVAAPVFSEVMTQAMRTYEIPPSVEAPNFYPVDAP